MECGATRFRRQGAPYSHLCTRMLPSMFVIVPAARHPSNQKAEPTRLAETGCTLAVVFWPRGRSLPRSRHGRGKSACTLSSVLGVDPQEDAGPDTGVTQGDQQTEPDKGGVAQGGMPEPPVRLLRQRNRHSSIHNPCLRALSWPTCNDAPCCVRNAQVGAAGTHRRRCYTLLCWASDTFSSLFWCSLRPRASPLRGPTRNPLRWRWRCANLTTLKRTET